MPLELFHILRAGVLNALIGVMDYSGWRLAEGHRLAQRRYRQPRCQRALQRPADRLAREAVDHHRQKHKLGPQPDVGDVGYPKLVDAAESHARRQVDEHWLLMLRIGGQNILAIPNRQQVVFSHNPGHPFVIDAHSLPMQLGRDPPVTVTPMMCQCDLLNADPLLHLRLVRRLLL